MSAGSELKTGFVGLILILILIADTLPGPDWMTVSCSVWNDIEDCRVGSNQSNQDGQCEHLQHRIHVGCL